MLTMEEALKGSSVGFSTGQIVKGKIIEVRPKEVLVDIGYKSEGAVNGNEFDDIKTVKVGDEVDVLIEKLEDKDGMVVLRARATKIDRSDLPTILVLAAIWVAIPFTLFPIAQQWIDSSIAGMLNGATPIFTAVIATILHRALPGPLQVTGLVLGFAGILAIALPSAGGGTTAVIGVALIVLATLGYAVSLNMVPPLQRKYGSLPLMARIEWIALPMVVPFGLVGVAESTFAWPSLLAVTAVGILGTGLAFVLMGNLAGSVGATRASFLTYLIPVVALALGIVFRDEIVSPVAIVGAGLVIFGAILASRREVPRGEIAVTPPAEKPDAAPA
jgi:drug/metabolite transporter (DMT)-like permease